MVYSKGMSQENHLHITPVKRRKHYQALLLLLPPIVFATVLALLILVFRGAR